MDADQKAVPDASALIRAHPHLSAANSIFSCLRLRLKEQPQQRQQEQRDGNGDAEVDDAAAASNPAHGVVLLALVELTRATAAGLRAGVYHFAHPELHSTTNGAVQEADYLLGIAGNFIGPGYLRPVLDLETGSGSIPEANSASSPVSGG